MSKGKGSNAMGRQEGSRGPRGASIGCQGIKGHARGVPRGKGGDLRCPIGSLATFDGITGYLKDPIGS